MDFSISKVQLDFTIDQIVPSDVWEKRDGRPIPWMLYRGYCISCAFDYFSTDLALYSFIGLLGL